MTTFDNRDNTFENKFAHDEQLNFKINARRNKLLGLWAAEKLHLAADKAEAYAKEVVMSDFDRPGDDDVFEKVTQDFKDAGLKVTPEELRAQMTKLLDVARAQVKAE